MDLWEAPLNSFFFPEGLNISFFFLSRLREHTPVFPPAFSGMQKRIFFLSLGKVAVPSYTQYVSFPPFFLANNNALFFSLCRGFIRALLCGKETGVCLCLLKVGGGGGGGGAAHPGIRFQGISIPSKGWGQAGYTVWERKRRTEEGKKENTYGNRQVFRCCSIKVKKVLIWSLRIYCT